ncbi:MAG: phosphoglycerate kinase [Alphaproteobacteria bacterium]
MPTHIPNIPPPPTPQDLNGKRALVRVDFNVPLTENQKVRDPSRLHAAIPGLLDIAKQGARVILISHLAPDNASLQAIADTLSTLLPQAQKFSFCPDLLGDPAKEAVQDLKAGEILLLENLRHNPGERANNPDFARNLANYADLFINDAFSVCHRPHASIISLPRRMHSFAGPLLTKERNALNKYLPPEKTNYPNSLALIGGAKISTKMPLLKSLAQRFSVLAVGGGIANTLLAADLSAKGVKLGDSLIEHDALTTTGNTGSAQHLREVLKASTTRLLLPEDFSVRTTSSTHSGTPRHVTRAEIETDGLRSGEAILDIGPQTIKTLKQEIANAQLCAWNGPFGFFEEDSFANGSLAIATALAERHTKHGAKCQVVVGGGETLAVVALARLSAENFSHLSTAGGAFLVWLEGAPLVGIRALTQKPEFGGPSGPDPTRYGDWERNGRALDF